MFIFTDLRSDVSNSLIPDINLCQETETETEKTLFTYANLINILVIRFVNFEAKQWFLSYTLK